MKFIPHALVCAALLAAAGAHAEGLVIGGSVGSSHFKGDDVGGLATDRSSSAYKLYGGYAFNPTFSLEAGYADLGKFSSDAGNVKAHAYFADGVATIPVANSVSALARVGLVHGTLDSSIAGSDSGSGIKLGAGLQYDLDTKTSLRGEWERYRFDALGSYSNTDVYSIGLHYKF